MEYRLVSFFFLKDREMLMDYDVYAAQTISETLAVLAALRPRAAKRSDTGIATDKKSNDEEPTPSGVLTPSARALHALRRSLPTQSSSRGWRGTLPPTQPKAMRDDRTLLVKPGAPAAAATATATATGSTAATRSATATQPATPAPAAAASASAAPGAVPYPYAYAGYGQYANGAYAYTQAAAAHGYAYANNVGWYNTYAAGSPAAATPAAAAGASAAGTPVQGASYAHFWGQQATAGTGTGAATASTPAATGQAQAQTLQAPQPQRAVANTVAPRPYAAAAQGQAPTLPAHLRTGAAGAGAGGSISSPGTPVQVRPASVQPAAATAGYKQ
jgi:hypothetical protein